MSGSNGDGKKVVCLGMPSYGTLTVGAAQGFYLASTGRVALRRKVVEKEELTEVGLDPRLQHSAGSLLALNFNLLWCWALNEARKHQVDYFAMLHSDVEPKPGWLDILIAELEAKDLDVLAAVVPIKDQRGVTSTAMAHPGGSTWRVHGRLTMQEVYRLPETFTSDDLGHPLLLNTGCWVCKFGGWTKKAYFTVNDRIVWCEPKQEYVPENEPEDWFFSRLCHEMGLRLGATRKVGLGHVGPFSFGNHNAWGEEYDSHYLERSVLDAGDDSSWFPEKVVGWLTAEEGKELAQLAEGKAVLEIGAYCGRSTICLARKAKNVTVVDTFDGKGTAVAGDTYPTFAANLRRHGVAARVSANRGTSEELLPGFPPVFDLVFIDGSHDRDSVSRDAELAMGRLKPNGLLVFHDYGRTEGDEGVTEAVDQLLQDGGELLCRRGSLAVVRPPVLVLAPASLGD